MGAAVAAAAEFLPETILHGIVAVSGAVVFYDTIFKAFKKIFARINPDGDK